MTHHKNLSFLLAMTLVMHPSHVSSQVPIDTHPVKVYEILDRHQTRLGTALVASTEGRGYDAGYEFWRFSESALLEITRQESLTFAVLAQGAWDDAWVVEALAWQPLDLAVEWSHPAAVRWIPADEVRPPIVPDGAYFGDSTIGGLTIRYSARGPSSLTWFKLTEGDFMQLEDGAVFERHSESPETGWWWHGPIE